MKPITLKQQRKDGVSLEATFLPGKGMNLASFKCGAIEVIDQSTKEDFENKFAGLGALIGPHFHRRNPKALKPIPDEELFPHIALFKEEGRADPFSHGIGRYAPWKAEWNENSLQATLSGDDSWNGIPLSELEGQKFKMGLNARLVETGLQLDLSVVSETDSLVGIHYYYHLPNGKGTVVSQVKDTILQDNQKVSLPHDWVGEQRHRLNFSLDRKADFTFYPYPDPLEGKITLETETHDLVTRYRSNSAENSWQLWHPEGASFVCIEPLSAQNPRRPNLTVSSIHIELEIHPR